MTIPMKRKIYLLGVCSSTEGIDLVEKLLVLRKVILTNKLSLTSAGYNQGNSNQVNPKKMR